MFFDADGDGFGNPSVVVNSCTAIEGYMKQSDDCDDIHADTYPDASEVCDEKNNDCDDSIDEG